MLTNYFNYFFEEKISLDGIEKSILEVQKKIYYASKLLEENRLYRERKNFLFNHDAFLFITKNAIKNIKKKLIKVFT